MKRNLILTIAILWATAACGPATTASNTDLEGETPAAETSAGVPDTEIGLSKDSVFDTPEPIAVVAEASDPGDKAVVPRTSADMAPQIPHGIGDIDSITLAENPCMECHDGSGGRAIPASHKTDLRVARDKVSENLVGARYLCVSCHVARTDAKPLVENAR